MEIAKFSEVRTWKPLNRLTKNLAQNTCARFYILIWWLADLYVTVHVFCNDHWAIIFIFAVLGLWLSSRSYTCCKLGSYFTINSLYQRFAIRLYTVVLARDVIHLSLMLRCQCPSVCPSVCLWRKCIGAL